MSYDAITPTKFGLDLTAQRHDPLTETVHLWTAGEIRPVSHVPPITALDQEDLEAQGIDTSALIPGAPKVDALGSCVPNAGTCSLATEYHAHRKTLPAGLGPNVVTDEDFAIRLYHTISQWVAPKWTDSGSTGLQLCQRLQAEKLITGWKAATNVQAVCSLLQAGTVVEGKPWFNAWFEPDADGIIDGNGTIFDFERAVASGVAGGHETCQTGIDPTGFKISVTGTVEQCLIDERNSWSQEFGIKGNYKIHLTTLGYLQAYADWKQFVL